MSVVAVAWGLVLWWGVQPSIDVAPEATAPDDSSVVAPAPAPAESAVDEPPPELGPGMESAPPGDASAPATGDDPAPLPEGDRAEPPGRVGAVGGGRFDPLPPPPGSEDPSTLDFGPWRGRGFIELRIDGVFPVGGEPIAGGNVISGLGGIAVGWRASEVLALSAGAATFIHDAQSQTVLDEVGEPTRVRSFGRITVFDLAALRAHVPVRGRIQPWGEIGAGVGWYAGPRASTRPAVGTARGGLGVDFWLGPTFALGIGIDYRLLAIRNSIGHRLQTGLRAGIHW